MFLRRQISVNFLLTDEKSDIGKTDNRSLWEKKKQILIVWSQD